MSRPHFRKFNNQDWEARKAEKQKQWEQRQAEKAKRQAEWEARKAARKAEIEARRKAQQELAAARKAERAKRKAEREKEIAKKRAEIAQRKRERLERQKRELERLSNKSETFTKRVSFTAINDGKPYLVDEDARLLYGIRDAAGDIQHAEGEVVFENATNPQELLRLGKQKLKEVSKPQVSYEAEVVSLGRAGFDPDGVGIGDAVQIIDTTFTPPIRVEGRVLKIEEDLLDSVDATRITLGNIHESYTQKRRAQEQKLDELIAQSSEWNAVAEGNGLYVRDLIGRMNEIMNGVGGYVYLKPGIGIIIYDKPENQHPTRAIQLGGGYWRTANSRKSNGDWDWKNIASGEGIFANAITTGRLMDAQGRNWWNMDTGEFSLQSTVKIGGKTISQITDELMTQDAIFNKLTNNGETQGIYMSGGHLYLNAEYMSTGVLSDARGLNRWDLRTGEFSLQASTTIGGKTIDEITNESLTQDAIFNKLTNNGETQGIYMSGGHLYLNASYMRTGTIFGNRGKWDLDGGIITMWDSAGNETVRLDGNGASNKIVGEFRTSLPGEYGVVVSPNFTTVYAGDSYYKGKGSGIEFDAPEHYVNPSIASENESNDGSTLSSLWAASGRVSKHDPAASLTLSESYDDGKYAEVILKAFGDYDERATALQAGVYAQSFPNSSSGGGYSELFSNNGRESCFVRTDVTNGSIYFNGALGEKSNRNTFVTYQWAAMPNGMGARQHEIIAVDVDTPAKYGKYYAVVSSDTYWGQVNAHIADTGRAGGWKIGLENNVDQNFDWSVYASTFGWLQN